MKRFAPKTLLPVLSLVSALAASAAGATQVPAGEGGAAPASHDPALARRTAWVIGGGVGAVYLYGLTSWWGEGFEPDFKVKREGWFGPDSDHGGQDKLGHFMFTYAGARLGKWGFEALGHTPDTALKLGVLTSWGALTGVELIDGFARKWSFSPEDFLMNTLGAGAAIFQERSPGFDRLVDFRFNYWPSTLPDGARRGWEPISDYSGQTYYLALKAEGVPLLERAALLRYLELSLGYGARGFEAGGEPVRSTYVGVSLNVGKLMRENVFTAPDSRARRVSDNLFEYVQFQPAAAWNERRF